MSKNWKFNLPSRKTSTSRLESVPESSVASTTASVRNDPSVTTAVKSMAHVLLGPTGRTPIDNIIQMQHFQLWGFLLVVAGLLYIVWLMQKKLDAIDKQYKEQFVLLHRLFKSHQDLQVEVRKTTTAAKKPTNVLPAVPSVTSVTSVEQEDAAEEVQEAHEVHEVHENTLELVEEPELCFDEHPEGDAGLEQEGAEGAVEEVVVAEEWNEPVAEPVVEGEEAFETFE